MYSLIAAALRGHHDPERVAVMLRKGAEVQVLPRDDGRLKLTLAFGDGAEVLAAMRAAVWSAAPEQAPARGSEERDQVLTLGVFPTSALAALPRG